MGDVGDTFNVWKEDGKKRRESNRANSPGILSDKGVKFTSKNSGAHLIVEGTDCLIDFWPGTGKFITRQGKHGRGVFNLIKLCTGE